MNLHNNYNYDKRIRVNYIVTDLQMWTPLPFDVQYDQYR